MAERGNSCKCGVPVREMRTTREYRMNGTLIMVFNDVPTGVCPKCGEEFLKGDIAEKMEAMALKKEGLEHVTFVPHVSLEPVGVHG